MPSSGQLRRGARLLFALSGKRGRAGCISEDPVKGGCAHARALDEPQDVEVSPDGKNVYVTSFDSNSVAIFDRDPTTGALTQKPGAAGCISGTGTGGACQLGHSIGTPLKVLVSPDGKNVYLTSAIPNDVAIFDRDPTTGALTQKPGLAGCASEAGPGDACEQLTRGSLKFPDGAAISPDGPVST